MVCVKPFLNVWFFLNKNAIIGLGFTEGDFRGLKYLIHCFIAGALLCAPERVWAESVFTPDIENVCPINLSYMPMVLPHAAEAHSYQYEEPAQPLLEKGADEAMTSLPSDNPSHKPMIAIVIDDMGVDKKRSLRVLDLPSEISTAFLPYGRDIQKQADTAREKGHELILHLPMEPSDMHHDPGPDFLSESASAAELHARLVKNLSAFEGYIAVNNHMGSRFTRDRNGLSLVMNELSARGLMFLDSMTSPQSIAFHVAQEKHMAATQRDVFLDDTETRSSVEKYLHKTEEFARRHGSAVAIGHPKDVTISALKEWIPALEKKGFQLVPLSRVIAARQPLPDAITAENTKGPGIVP